MFADVVLRLDKIETYLTERFNWEHKPLETKEQRCRLKKQKSMSPLSKKAASQLTEAQK